ncbi:hypothetical protein AABB24_010698 [Solanum stoloniferum]|uniref:Uncharacterized protein n=1 Tax=Solanum stoloniferum TaxID=62892 RepID=A0ABD2UAB7_9SOLN
MRKITSLIDLNITEVTPHPCLKPSKCLALIRSLPSLLGTRMMQYTMPRLCILTYAFSILPKRPSIYYLFLCILMLNTYTEVHYKFMFKNMVKYLGILPKFS